MCEARIENIEQRIISRPEDALFYFKRFRNYNKEHCFALYLNAKNKVTRLEVNTIGFVTLDKNSKQFFPTIKCIINFVLAAVSGQQKRIL